MEKNFVIRKANLKDLKDILKLNLELFKKEYEEYDKSLNLKWTYKEGKKYFRNRITKKDGFVEVVEYKGKIIGYLCGEIAERLFYRKKAKYAELENMLVEKKFRGKGLGSKLTKDFINWCKKNRIDYISVRASVGNKFTINFYRELGFKDYDLTLEMKLNRRKRN